MTYLMVNGQRRLLNGVAQTITAVPTVASLAVIDYQVSQGTNVGTAMHVIQRAPGLTTRDIPVVFGFTVAAPLALEGRVRLMSSGAVVLDWTAMTGLACATGTGSCVLPGVPQGGPYILDLRDGVTRPTSGALYSSTSLRWGVGVNIKFDGQSNMQATLGGGYLTYNVPGTGGMSELAYYASGAYTAAMYDSAGWHGPSNGNTYFGPDGGSTTTYGSANDNMWALMRFIALGLKTKYGYDVPVGLCPRAYSGQSIESFTAPSGAHYLENIASGAAGAGAGMLSSPPTYCGDFEVVVYHQGEANNGDTQAAYQAKLAALYPSYLGMVAPYGRTAANLWFLPAVIGNIDVAVGASLEAIRSAEQSFEAYAATQGWPKVRVGWTTIDLARGDQYHMGGAQAQISARRMVQSVLYALGCATFSGRGPRLGSVSRAGLVATVQVTHEGGTALQTPGTGAVTGFLANTAADFSGTAVAVTAAISGAAAVGLTFPAGTVFPVYVKYLGGQIGTAASCNPDVSNCLYDNVAYPSVATGADVPALGLPLLPTISALVVA